VSTQVLTSQAFGTALDRTDQFFAGWSGALTNDLTTRARASMYGELATRNHHGAIFEAGRAVGTVHSVALSFGNPCGASAVAKYGLKAINGVQAIGSSANGYENFMKGDYAAAAMDALAIVGNVATLLKSCFAAG